MTREPSPPGVQASSCIRTETPSRRQKVPSGPLQFGGSYQVTDTYDALNRLSQRDSFNAAANWTFTRGYAYDALERLARINSASVGGSVSDHPQDDNYSYDNANNPTQINDTLLVDNYQQTCFSYDGLDRLTVAWTKSVNCNGYAATTAGGPAGFNQQYSYAADGVPTSVTNLGTATTYSTGDSVHPHAITGFGSNSYSYDTDGQQVTRTVGGVATTLSWDPLHHLYQSATSTATTRYVNAADGSRIARLDPDGSTTMWVAGNEIHVANGVATATRYYSMAGATIAQQTGSGMTWLASDGQNSRQLAVDATTATATRTYYLPYGAQRAGAQLLPTDQNFLGRVLDGSGLLQDGARYYDPSLGQFLTPDPLVNTTDSKTLDPYGYAANNPAAFADPTGMMNASMGGGGCGSLSISQCAAQELGDLSVADLLASGGGTDTGADKSTGPSTAGKAGGDAADIGVQAVNDTKDAPTGALNGIKDFFASLFGGAEAAACGSSCAATAAQTGSAPPLFGPEDTPDIPSGADIPLPFKFRGPKILLTGGGYIASLLLGGAFGKLGDLATARLATASDTWSIDVLSSSGSRIVGKDLTRAGQELAKHAGQGRFPVPAGSPSMISRVGQQQLDDILTSRGTRIEDITKGNFAGGRYYIAPDGRGAAFDSSGVFQYFGVFGP